MTKETITVFLFGLYLGSLPSKWSLFPLKDVYFYAYSCFLLNVAVTKIKLTGIQSFLCMFSSFVGGGIFSRPQISFVRQRLSCDSVSFNQ